MKEIYFVTDVETTGKVPGFCSMLSIGCVAVAPHGEDLVTPIDVFPSREIPEGHTKGEFYLRLVYDLANDGIDPDTLAWWEEQRKASSMGLNAYNEAFMKQPRTRPASAMRDLAAFVDVIVQANALDGVEPKAIFVARPAAFDRPFIEYQFHKAGIASPFSKRSLDMSSYAFGQSVKDAIGDLDSRGYDLELGVDYDQGHDHTAIGDARHLANVLRIMLAMRAVEVVAGPSTCQDGGCVYDAQSQVIPIMIGEQPGRDEPLAEPFMPILSLTNVPGRLLQFKSQEKQ